MNTSLERLELTKEELEILRTHWHPRGAAAILRILGDFKRRARGREFLEWVTIDEIQARTGQRAIHSRIAELRNRWKVAIEHNGRAGGSSAYRLVDSPPAELGAP